MVERALLGAIVAALVTALARRLQALDESGQWAAFACGILASAGGWPWAGVLVGYFVLATAVTTLGEAEKQRRTERSVPQVNTRNAFQVAANGGVFALLAARALSGGNQQKIVIARELSRPFVALLAAQPTRGVDVGAIEFIHGELRKARAAGKAVLLVSAELREVLSLADRIAVMYLGRIIETGPASTAFKFQL